MKSAEYLVGLALCLAGTTSEARASTIFSNLGPGDSYAPPSYTVQTSVFVAAPFVVPGSNYILGQIDLPLALDAGVNSVTVELTRNAGGVPGSTIESWVFNDLTPFPNMSPPLSATSVSHPILDAGTEYWMVALATDPSTVAVWNLNNIGENSTLAFSYTGRATWILTAFPAQVPAFDVLGTAIPEPGCGSALALGLAVILWFPQIRQRLSVANSKSGFVAKSELRSGRVDGDADYPVQSVQGSSLPRRGDPSVRPLVPTIPARL